MTTEATSGLLTAEEFFALPVPPDGARIELISGRVVRHMPASGKHCVRVLSIGRRLAEFVEANHLGTTLVEAGFILARDPDLVRAPEVAFLADEDTPVSGIPEEGFIEQRPTLAVEVVSPNDLDSMVTDKVADYLDAGVPRVWAVRPKRKLVTVPRRRLGPRTRHRQHPHERGCRFRRGWISLSARRPLP
jgi:Uma2 family endonuclease